jgi:hypothetical protein
MVIETTSGSALLCGEIVAIRRANPADVRRSREYRDDTAGIVRLLP